MKDLFIVTNDHLGRIIYSLRNSPIDLLSLLVMYLSCSPNLIYYLNTYRGVFDVEFDLP